MGLNKLVLCLCIIRFIVLCFQKELFDSIAPQFAKIGTFAIRCLYFK